MAAAVNAARRIPQTPIAFRAGRGGRGSTITHRLQTLGGSTVLLCLTIGRTRRSALVPDDRVWRKMGNEVNGRRVAVHLHAGLTSKEESLLRLRAPTCLDLPTHGALSQFGFFVWVLLRCNCTHPPSIVF